MKSTLNLIAKVCIVATIGLMRCQCEKEIFNGEIRDNSGTLLEGSTIEIYVNRKESKEQDEVITVSKDGKFTVEVPKGEKYVVNISKQGYGSISKIYYKGTAYKYELPLATKVTLPADTQIDVVDTQQNCVDGIDSTASFTNPSARIPFVYDQTGKLIDFKIPDVLKNAYNEIASKKCTSGGGVSIPSDGLVDEDGNEPVGDVIVNISTINQFARDGMPGDRTSRDGKELSFMISVGAVSVDAYSGNKLLKLRKAATLTIPFDPSVFPDKKQIPESIPFLTYDKKSGIWIREGDIRLNEERTAYVKQVEHLSSFNVDYMVTNGACAHIQVQGAIGTAMDPDFWIKIVSANNTGTSLVSDWNLFNGWEGPPYVCGTAHYELTRLVPNQPVGIIYYTTSPSLQYLSNSIIYLDGGLAGGGAAYYTDCTEIQANCVPVSGKLDIGTNSDFDSDTGQNPTLIGKHDVGGGTFNLAWANAFSDLSGTYYLYRAYKENPVVACTTAPASTTTQFNCYSSLGFTATDIFPNDLGGSYKYTITEGSGSVLRFIVVAVDDPITCTVFSAANPPVYVSGAGTTADPYRDTPDPACGAGGGPACCFQISRSIEFIVP